jgi:hypothetical protein
MLDASGVGAQTIQDFLCPILGTWHPYKQASLVIMRNIATFMAPLFHNAHPGAKYFFRPSKLSKITFWLSVMRLSFPGWKDAIETLLADGDWKCKNAQNLKMHKHLSNLHLTVTYLIPLVSCFFLPIEVCLNCDIILCSVCRSTITAASSRLALSSRS